MILLLAAFCAAAPARAAQPAPVVVMDEYIVARAAETPLVRTSGVATCVAVTLFDPTTQTGALAHVSAFAKVGPSMDAVLRDLLAAGARRGNIRAQLIGGWRTTADGPMGFKSTSPEIVAALSAFLSKQGIPVTRQETLVEPTMAPGGPRSIRNLRFDLASGTLQDYEPAAGDPPGGGPAQLEEFHRTSLLTRHPLSAR